MIVYFAYGSNMASTRLEARVGAVEVVGLGQLREYRHGFTKLGRDGTGKGNIVYSRGDSVYGVLYRLEHEQMVTLTGFEGGYRRVAIAVDAVDSARSWAAETFQALAPMRALAPTTAYIDHYFRGMREHGVPPAYRRWIREQAERVDPGLAAASGS